jgi:hypothetical protein
MRSDMPIFNEDVDRVVLWDLQESGARYIELVTEGGETRTWDLCRVLSMTPSVCRQYTKVADYDEHEVIAVHPGFDELLEAWKIVAYFDDDWPR